MTAPLIRPAVPEDAVVCAGIVNAWIDRTAWMPRIHDCDDVHRYYRDVVLETRQVWVAGDDQGFLAFDDSARMVTDLYSKPPGRGAGKALLDHVKTKSHALALWTFQANDGAQRFYRREGFTDVERTEGDNQEGLPDLRMTWTCAPMRRAGPGDVPDIARIVNTWIDQTPWMPRTLAGDAITSQIRTALPHRDIFLIGDPAFGYVSLNPDTHLIGALYVDRPGQGFGKALMDRAKTGRDYLHLWTHEANIAAQRFYRREGFQVIDRTEKGGDGLPELHMEWRQGGVDHA